MINPIENKAKTIDNSRHTMGTSQIKPWKQANLHKQRHEKVKTKSWTGARKSSQHHRQNHEKEANTIDKTMKKQAKRIDNTMKNKTKQWTQMQNCWPYPTLPPGGMTRASTALEVGRLYMSPHGRCGIAAASIKVMDAFSDRAFDAYHPSKRRGDGGIPMFWSRGLWPWGPWVFSEQCVRAKPFQGFQTRHRSNLLWLGGFQPRVYADLHPLI